METYKLTTLITAAALLLLTACGGGSAPAPAPNFPAAVTEISEDDLHAAGMPALPDENGVSAARAASADFDGDGVVDAADYVLLHNLTPTSDGFVTSVPEDTTSRIIGWVLYKLPGEPGQRTRSLSVTDLIIDPAVRVFAAVSNFSAGRWEPLSRQPLGVGSANGGVWKLSAGPRYNRQNGDSFLLLAVAHPGHGEMSGYSIKLEDILISSYRESDFQFAFDAGTPGGASFGPGFIDYIAQLRDAAGGTVNRRLRQQFLSPADLGTPVEPMLLFPQPLNLDSADGSDWFGFQQIVGDWNGDGADTIGFYDPAEANGPRHAYRLGVWDDTDIAHVVSIVPVTQRGGDNILIGLLIPAPAVQTQISISVDPAADTPERVTTVNPRGEFELQNIDGLAPGTYAMSLNFEEIKVTYVAELMEEEGIFYFAFDPAS